MSVATLTGTVTDRATGLLATRTTRFTVTWPPPVFGMNYDVDAGLGGVASALGTRPLRAAKFFNNGMPGTYPGHQLPASVTMPLASVKPGLPMSALDQATLAGLARQAAQLTALRPMLTLWQEGENKGFTPAVLKGAHALAYKIVKAAAPSVRYGQCLMTWSASGHTSFGPLSDWVATQANGQPLDWYGFDTYPNSPSTGPGVVLDRALAELKSVVPNPVIAITECNYTTDLTGGITYTADSQAHWFRDAWTWAVAHGCITFICYFYSPHGVPWPPVPATMTELTAIARASGL